MPKKNDAVAWSRRAWSLLHLAFLWAHKNRLFKRRLMPKFLKGLGHLTMLVHTCGCDRRPRYQECQFSFDENPITDVKVVHRSASMRFLLPCISTAEAVDFDRYSGLSIDEYDDGVYGYDGGNTKSYSAGFDSFKDEEEDGEDEEWRYQGCNEKSLCPYTFSVEEEEGIDSKAEKFYSQVLEGI